MLTEVISREFTNGKVYMLRTEDGFPLEVTVNVTLLGT